MLLWFVLNGTEPRPHSFPFARTCLLDTSLRPCSVPYLFIYLRSYFFFSKSFSAISFTDPHLLTSLESHRFKKRAGRGHFRHSNSLAPNPLRFSPFADPPPRNLCHLNLLQKQWGDGGGIPYVPILETFSRRGKTPGYSLCPSPQRRFEV